MTALFSYYLAAGTISKATLIGSSSNNIENFSLQSDMSYGGVPWTIPHDKPSVRMHFQRKVKNANGYQIGDGGYNGTWGFEYFSEGQMAYFFSTFYSSSRSVFTAAVTLQTRVSDDGSYQAFSCLMTRPDEGTLELGDRGYLNAKFEFNNGVLIT